MNAFIHRLAWEKELEIRREIERMDHRQDDPRDAALYRKSRHEETTNRITGILGWIHRRPACETC